MKDLDSLETFGRNNLLEGLQSLEEKGMIEEARDKIEIIIELLQDLGGYRSELELARVMSAELEYDQMKALKKHVFNIPCEKLAVIAEYWTSEQIELFGPEYFEGNDITPEKIQFIGRFTILQLRAYSENGRSAGYFLAQQDIPTMKLQLSPQTNGEATAHTLDHPQ